MYRQSPGRSHRSKGFKIKHVLQFCFLVAVCFWLIHQIKHSQHKKKELDKSNAEDLRGGITDDFIRLGRKDIRPRAEETVNKNERHDEASKEEENEIEEDEPEEKDILDVNKGKEGSDGIVENEQEKSDIEVDQEEDSADDENVTEENVSEDSTDQGEKEIVDNTDRKGDDGEIHDSRDDNYKADDASSAVTHGTRIENTENETESENSKKHPEYMSENGDKENNSDEINKGEDGKELEMGSGEIAKGGGNQSNATSEVEENMLENSENGSSFEQTEINVSDDLLETSNSSTNVSNASTLDVDSERLQSDATNNAESNSINFSSSSNDTETSVLENAKLEPSIEALNNNESSIEENDMVDSEKESEASDGTDGVLASETTEDTEEFSHDFIDSSDSVDSSDSINSLEEKDVRMDLDTLPDIQTEGTNSEDAAAE